MIPKNKPLVSILISNFNKEKFLKKCIQSCLKQNYPYIEVIFFDDKSTDNSIKYVKKFKKVKVFINKNKKKKYPALNQIHALVTVFKKSKGDIICLLDSDDFFRLNKIKIIVNYFKKNPNTNFIQDTPIKFKDNKIKSVMTLKKKINLFTIWPSFFPTSTISIKRNFFKKFMFFISKNNYPNLEIDARLAMYAYFTNNFQTINKCLTYYTLDPTGITFEYKKYSKKWWLKREDAHKYMAFILKKMGLKRLIGFDFIITKIMNYLFKK